MSRRENNRKRMDEARKRRKARNNSAHEGNGIPDNEERASGMVTIVDKFTGEIREGGPELIKEQLDRLARSRKMFLASTNPCYLIGRVVQNEASFTADEVKKMVDATFECAIRGSCDAWYPNQYALALAYSSPQTAMADIGAFLCNFELGLRTSGQRAAKHRGKGDWLKESRKLAERLNDPAAMSGMTEKDVSDIVSHVEGHPRFAEAMNWYERCSGKKMSWADPVRAGGNEGGDNLRENPQILQEMKKTIAQVVGKFVIQRADVESLNLAPFLSSLTAILKDREAVVRHRHAIRPSICGYGDDPRELYQIPEVRAFLSLLDKQFPYWFYFVAPDCYLLPVLMACLCPVDGVSISPDHIRATIRIRKEDIWAFLETHFDAMNSLLDRFQLDAADETLNKKLTQQVMEALKLSSDD